jgi:hypothetical protein
MMMIKGSLTREQLIDALGLPEATLGNNSGFVDVRSMEVCEDLHSEHVKLECDLLVAVSGTACCHWKLECVLLID